MVVVVFGSGGAVRAGRSRQAGPGRARRGRGQVVTVGLVDRLGLVGRVEMEGWIWRVGWCQKWLAGTGWCRQGVEGWGLARWGWVKQVGGA